MRKFPKSIWAAAAEHPAALCIFHCLALDAGLAADQFELVLDLKTAKTLGLTIPQSVLAHADEVMSSWETPAARVGLLFNAATH